jgi:hypothetical protein
MTDGVHTNDHAMNVGDPAYQGLQPKRFSISDMRNEDWVCRKSEMPILVMMDETT